MKSLEELAAIRNKMKDKVALREKEGDIRIVVGMATCGIAAGARPVLNAFVEEVSKQHADNATVTQTGCIGIVRLNTGMSALFEHAGNTFRFKRIDFTTKIDRKSVV